ncbi:MAG TPA: hypothetical protein VFB51_14580 [Solirubrobacterales bacterium]|nr:hypothetical protein [Solirubrobacterales bacterium]
MNLSSNASRLFQWGGLAAGAVLIAFGIAAIVMGFDGRSTVSDTLEQEKIVGTPDMTPALTEKAVAEADLSDIDVPSCSVAGKSIDTGSEARCFADYLRIHALEGSGGFVYAEMGRFEAKEDTPKAELATGGGTDNAKFAAVDPETGQPASNGARNVWVTATALGTALNASYMAERISVFGIVVGVALLLSGVGFIVLALATLRRSRA